MAVVRRLGADDVWAWRALRLEALERHPEAFGASFEEEAALEPAAWLCRLEHGVVLGALQHGMLVGSAGLVFEAMRKKRHKAVLWGVYVRAEARGAGLGRALVAAAIEAAQGRATQLHAAVVSRNDRARRVYRELGFATYGLEPGAIEVAGRYLDEELLVLHLHGAEERTPVLKQAEGR
jgi:ribosomal protein S18 acetylase RimI-like enzyme